MFPELMLGTGTMQSAVIKIPGFIFTKNNVLLIFRRLRFGSVLMSTFCTFMLGYVASTF